MLSLLCLNKNDLIMERHWFSGQLCNFVNDDTEHAAIVTCLFRSPMGASLSLNAAEAPIKALMVTGRTPSPFARLLRT